MEEIISESERSTFKVLNEGLMAHMAKQDPSVDWTTIMQYYLQQAAKIRNKPEPKFDAPSAAPAIQTTSQASQPTAPQPSNFASNGASLFSASATPKAFGSNTSNMFAAVNAQQTPKQQSLFHPSPTKPPATAPVSRKRPGPFMDDDEGESSQPPATEKRARLNEPIQYPELPENASATAKLFQAALDKPAEEDTARPEKQPSPAPSFGGFRPPSASSAGFAPSKSASPAPPGMPTFSAPSSNAGGFLAAFGKKAGEEEEKARKKRKMEDYDSDEETEEAWAKRDQEEQEKKRQKILEAGKKGNGFVVSATPSEAAVSEAGDDGDEDKAEPEKEQGKGDHTWKPSTPIKFGAGSSTGVESTTPAAPPPAFGNLFGSSAQTSGAGSTGHLNVPGAKPSLGFNFGPASAGTSRASTPGVTTDGEGASTAGEGEEEDAEPSDPQMEDKAALLPKELEGNDLLLKIPGAKASRFGEKKDPDSGEMTIGWVPQATGPLYVLREKTTSKTRVLLKMAGMGKAKMNFLVQKPFNFDSTGKSGKFVQGMFLDGFDATKEGEKDANATPKAPGRPGKWLINANDKETADELLSILNENKT